MFVCFRMAANNQSGRDGTVDVEFKGNVAIVKLNCGQNRINSEFTAKYNKALDEVER